MVNRNLNPGEYPGTRTLFVIQELSTVDAMLNALASDTMQITSGAEASVVATAMPGRTFPGTVVAVLGAVVPGSNTNATVKVQITNPGIAAAPAGMAVTGQVNLPAVSGLTALMPTRPRSFLDDTHTDRRRPAERPPCGDIGARAWH